MPPGSARPSSRRDVDAVAEDVAVLDDDVADVDADTELDAMVRRQRGIAFGHRRLHLGRATQRVDNAGELDQQAVAGRLDDAALWAAIFGSISLARSALNRPSVPSSSAPIRREQPATSVARIAAIRRSTRRGPAGSMAPPQWPMTLHQPAPRAH